MPESTPPVCNSPNKAEPALHLMTTDLQAGWSHTSYSTIYQTKPIYKEKHNSYSRTTVISYSLSFCSFLYKLPFSLISSPLLYSLLKEHISIILWSYNFPRNVEFEHVYQDIVINFFEFLEINSFYSTVQHLHKKCFVEAWYCNTEKKLLLMKRKK